MRVQVIKESGLYESLFALGLSFGLTSELTFDEFMEDETLRAKLLKVATNLAPKGKGHNSFMKQIIAYVDIDAPRYIWSELDTYKIGTAGQSESTMHTLSKRTLTQQDFERPISSDSLKVINDLILAKADIETLKEHLPEGFKQRRVIMMSYMTLRNIIMQRDGHRLKQWKVFNEAILSQLEHPELLGLKND